MLGGGEAVEAALAETREKLARVKRRPTIVLVPSLTDLRQTAERGALWEHLSLRPWHVPPGGLAYSVLSMAACLHSLMRGLVSDRQAMELIKTNACAFAARNRDKMTRRLFKTMTIASFVDEELRHRGNCHVVFNPIRPAARCPACVFPKEIKAALTR